MTSASFLLFLPINLAKNIGLLFSESVSSLTFVDFSSLPFSSPSPSPSRFLRNKCSPDFRSCCVVGKITLDFSVRVPERVGVAKGENADAFSKSTKAKIARMNACSCKHLVNIISIGFTYTSVSRFV